MLTVRRGVEWITRDWRFTRRMPRHFGGAPIRVSTAGGLRYLFKPMSAVDPELLELARELVKPGDCVWDVGANVGLFSVAAAALAGSAGAVVAVEADTWLCELLRHTARMQGADSARIDVVPAAAASSVGVVSFCIARRARSASYMHGFGYPEPFTGGVTEQQSVVALSLDALLASKRSPRVLKIDVEGAELEVLRGAAKLLGEVRPVILCEVGTDHAEVASQLRRHDYVLFDASLPRSRRAPLEVAVWSTLAMPAEHLERS